MNNVIKKERNYWPHAIIIVILLMIGACALVVKIAMDNPVQMDSFYFEKYQQVDENINEIRENQKIFEKNFSIEYETKKFIMNKNSSFKMSIKNLKEQNLVKDAEIKLVISRPETNEYNQEFNLKSSKDGIYQFNGIKVELPGRWQILTKIKIGDKSSFNNHEVYATK